MDATKRNLVTGLLGILVLLVSVLVCAHATSSQNYELDTYEQNSD